MTPRLHFLVVHCALHVYVTVSVCMKDHAAHVSVHGLTFPILLDLCLHAGIGLALGVASWLRELVSVDASDAFHNTINFVWLMQATTGAILPTWRSTKAAWATGKAALWHRVKMEVNGAFFTLVLYVVCLWMEGATADEQLEQSQ